MTERIYTLQICDCERLWTRDDLGMECWLCKTKVREVTAYANDPGDQDQPAAPNPAQETLL